MGPGCVEGFTGITGADSAQPALASAAIEGRPVPEADAIAETVRPLEDGRFCHVDFGAFLDASPCETGTWLGSNFGFVPEKIEWIRTSFFGYIDRTIDIKLGDLREACGHIGTVARLASNCIK